MLLQSGSATAAITESRPPSGAWASSFTTWSAATSPSSRMSRSATQTSSSEPDSLTSAKTWSDGASDFDLPTGSPSRTSCSTHGWPRTSRTWRRHPPRQTQPQQRRRHRASRRHRLRHCPSHQCRRRHLRQCRRRIRRCQRKTIAAVRRVFLRRNPQLHSTCSITNRLSSNSNSWWTLAKFSFRRHSVWRYIDRHPTTCRVYDKHY